MNTRRLPIITCFLYALGLLAALSGVVVTVPTFIEGPKQAITSVMAILCSSFFLWALISTIRGIRTVNRDDHQ